MPAILISDDAALLGELEKTFVRRNGIELLPVPTGADAIRLAREARPAAVILDTRIDSPDGLATCRTIKKEGGEAAPPVVLVGSPRDSDASLSAGADGFVPRPATRASLLGQIRRFLPARERATQRVPLGIRVVCLAEGERFVAFTADLSPTGLFLKSPRPPAMGSRLRVSFSLPGDAPEPIESEAEVVREVRDRLSPGDSAGSGLQFTSLPAERRMEITRFLRGAERV